MSVFYSTSDDCYHHIFIRREKKKLFTSVTLEQDEKTKKTEAKNLSLCFVCVLFEMRANGDEWSIVIMNIWINLSLPKKAAAVRRDDETSGTISPPCHKEKSTHTANNEWSFQSPSTPLTSYCYIVSCRE